VFLLDNLDLGIFNKKHDVLPRIKAFDPEWIRRLINMATDIGKVPRSYSSSPVSHMLWFFFPFSPKCYRNVYSILDVPITIAAKGCRFCVLHTSHCSRQPERNRFNHFEVETTNH
jgi:hypothetical protein